MRTEHRRRSLRTTAAWRYGLFCGAALCALAVKAFAPAVAASGESNTNDGNTTTPIKHVIVIIGENIKTCLEAVGATLADIVKTNTYVTDYPEFAKHPDMRMRYFGHATPTSTTVQISRLADPDAMVEIEAIAVIDG